MLRRCSEDVQKPRKLNDHGPPETGDDMSSPTSPRRSSRIRTGNEDHECQRILGLLWESRLAWARWSAAVGRFFRLGY